LKAQKRQKRRKHETEYSPSENAYKHLLITHCRTASRVAAIV